MIPHTSWIFMKNFIVTKKQFNSLMNEQVKITINKQFKKVVTESVKKLIRENDRKNELISIIKQQLEYFQILEDTLIGRMIPSFQKKPKRRIVHAPKFYFFDLGIANFLLKRTKIEKGSKEFGSSFEHFIYLETYAHSKYSRLNYTISYWRTTSQIEVDFVLGNHEVAIEVKATDNVQEKHTKGLREFSKDYQVRKLIIVSNDPHERKMGDIHIIPWEVYLEMLWNGLII